jgi:hypothetical protein
MGLTVDGWGGCQPDGKLRHTRKEAAVREVEGIAKQRDDG